MVKKFELYFNNQQEGGVDIFDPEKKKPPTAPGWYRIGSYDYDVAQDMVYLYSLIPFETRKKMDPLELGDRYWIRS